MDLRPINTLSVIGALLGGYPGIIDLLTLQNKVYFGHQENNYYSIDLFIIAALPILFVGFSWVVYFLNRSPDSIKH